MIKLYNSFGIKSFYKPSAHKFRQQNHENSNKFEVKNKIKIS